MKVIVLSAVERSSPVSYDNAGEQAMRVVTPLVAVLAVVNTFVLALLAVAFITDTGIELSSHPVSVQLTALAVAKYLFNPLIATATDHHISVQ